ncbi:MAG: DNA repair exonuclease [Pirellulaceae bacterium]|nr:DNA repair exonuclease [Planctomycetales bacterium]
MAGTAFRFIHSSDFHLEQPLHGVTEVPRHLHELFLDAAISAAERVFEAAVAERVDFVCLTGDLVHVGRGGPRALSFLHNQFLRLEKEGIAVYWSGGEQEMTRMWPGAVPLPANVTLIDQLRPQHHWHRRGETLLARITGRAWSPDERFSDLAIPATEEPVFGIAMLHGDFSGKQLNDTSVDYWALGGRHQPQTIKGAHGKAHYSGTPQGREPTDVGPHGCTLVDVDKSGGATLRTIHTDVARWYDEQFTLDDDADKEWLLREMRVRSRRLLDGASGRQLLVSWSVFDGDQLKDTKSDELAAQLREQGLAMEVLKSVRADFGQSTPGLWSVCFRAEPPAVLPAGWYQEETILGDLLRMIQSYQTDDTAPIDLTTWAEGMPLEGSLREALRVTDPGERQRLLRRVAVLGVDILRGDRILSDEASEMSWLRGSAATGASEE